MRSTIAEPTFLTADSPKTMTPGEVPPRPGAIGPSPVGRPSTEPSVVKADIDVFKSGQRTSMPSERHSAR